MLSLCVNARYQSLIDDLVDDALLYFQNNKNTVYNFYYL